jgi:hypothetical protein
MGHCHCFFQHITIIVFYNTSPSLFFLTCCHCDFFQYIANAPCFSPLLGLKVLTTLDFPLVVVCHHCRFLQHVTITTFSNRSLMHIVFLPLVVIIIITAFVFAMMVVVVNNQ